MTQVNWNGKDLPEEFVELPPGRYVVYPAEGALDLSPEEDADLRRSLDEAATEPGVGHDEARRRIRALLDR